MQGLLELPELAVLDIQENRVDDEWFLTEILAKMPKLGVLYNQGNPWIKKMKSYKKETTTLIKTLKYLDDWPVFEEDWRFAEAYCNGGIDAEREERTKVKKEKDEAHERNH